MSESSRFGIETDGAYAEVHFLIFLRHGFDDGGGAVVERLSIGRKSRPCLPVTGRRELGSRDDLIASNVEHYGIGTCVKDLDALTMMYKEGLRYAIGREGDVVGIRMPSGIGNAFNGVGKLRIEFLYMPAFDQH